jgi:hypothetical protein
MVGSVMNPLRYFHLGIVALVTAPLFTSTPSSAITAELAKKCRLMTIQARPTQLPGRKNTGVEAAQREYFSKCITNEGNMETAEDQNRAPNPNDKPPAIGAPSTVPSQIK